MLVFPGETHRTGTVRKQSISIPLHLPYLACFVELDGCGPLKVQGTDRGKVDRLGVEAMAFPPCGLKLITVVLIGRAFVELSCHRSLQNQPVGVESKPATLR